MNISIKQLNSSDEHFNRELAALLHRDTVEQRNIDDKVDIVYTVNENHFRGNTTLQLMIEKVVTL